MELWTIIALVLITLAVVGVWARVEFFVVPKIKKTASEMHGEIAKSLVADTHEQTERLAHLIKNHINGPAHRR